MIRYLAFTVIAAAAWGQSFEVASVKPIGPVEAGGGRSSTGPGGMGVGCDGHAPQVEGNRFTVTTTPYALITWAYGYNKTWGCSYVSFANLITGGPAWVRSERFEVQAVIPADAPKYTFDEFMRGDATQLEKMLQNLLTERFKLAVHRESKEVPVYALTVAKGGSKLTRPSPEDKKGFGMRRMPDQSNNLIGRKVEIRDLAFLLLMTTRRPVVDRTGLTGEFNFDLAFAPFDDSSAETTGPSLFTALPEQLGLRLDTTKAPLDGLVIDGAEKPSVN